MRLRWFGGILLLGLLAACAPTLEISGVGLDYRLGYGGAILDFAPDRGPGGWYYLGEEVNFDLTLARPGWVTLVVVDPDGRVYELDRFYLPAGRHLLPPGPYRYTLVPPRGLHRVRAVFTDTRPSARLEGVYTDWDGRLRLYLEASQARWYDVRETYFYLR